MDGRAYLEKFIADRLPAGQGQPAEGRRLSLDLSEIRGVALGLVAAGALTQEEMERIVADLEQKLERLGRLTRRQAHAWPELQGPLPVAVRRDLVLKSSLERPQWQDPVMEPPTLRDVISLAGRVLTIGGATACLVCLERWSAMLVLRLAYADPGDRLLLDHFRTQRERWRGWDDAGTQYRGGSIRGSGTHGLFMEDLLFEPGTPDEARTLTLCVDSDGQTKRLTVTFGAAPALA
jgi:hypothetical protein